VAFGARASFACSLYAYEKLSFRGLLGSPFKLSIAFTCGKASILGAYFIRTLVRGAMVATWGKFQLQVDLWFPPRPHFRGHLWTSRVHF